MQRGEVVPSGMPSDEPSPTPCRWSWLKAIGPGILLAGAAIGVSHLVQATRAGAEYRVGMIGLLILACATKYPFLQFGPRFAAATGKDLIEGYRQLGSWALWICFAVTFGSMFIIMAGVTVVTAALAQFLFDPYVPVDMSLTAWSGVMVLACMLLLVLGRYPALDRTMKLIMAVLLVSTITAVMMAAWSPSERLLQAAPPPWWSVSAFGFILAFMGWMPIPIDSAIWHSIWMQERARQTKHTASMREALIDFNFGYLLAGVVAIFFLALGALVMFNQDEAFQASGAGFARQFIELYGRTLGAWSVPIIAIAAFTTMFSTTLIVLDAFPRVMQRLTMTLRASTGGRTAFASYEYAAWVVAQAVLAVVILAYFGGQLVRMVDLATTLSFLTAPILAFINYRVIISRQVPRAMQPGRTMRVFSIASMLFLAAFSIAYLVWQITAR